MAYLGARQATTSGRLIERGHGRQEMRRLGYAADNQSVYSATRELSWE